MSDEKTINTLIKYVQKAKDIQQRGYLSLEKFKNQDITITGIVLRPIIGYDVTKLPGTQGEEFAETRKSTLESAAWENRRHDILVTASVSDTQRWGPLLHVSISRPDRHPSWQEISAMRHVFFPSTIDVMMVMPRESDYVNLHNHCFHLWQTPQEWGIG